VTTRRLDASERAFFHHIPTSDLERARLVRVPVLTPGIAGMTLGRWILLRRGHEHDRGLIAHELVHVRQWRELGAAHFVVRYLGAYARGRWRGLGHQAAYEAIPLEAEARALAGS
jgi:Domain of unknown function (DUF4157)